MSGKLREAACTGPKVDANQVSNLWPCGASVSSAGERNWTRGEKGLRRLCSCMAVAGTAGISDILGRGRWEVVSIGMGKQEGSR